MLLKLEIVQEGEVDVSCDRGNGKLTKGSCVLIKDGEKYDIINFL
jgi:mannose-6-phosphate isomerase-like protein (cupin superfamily)